MNYYVLIFLNSLTADYMYLCIFKKKSTISVLERMHDYINILPLYSVNVFLCCYGYIFHLFYRQSRCFAIEFEIDKRSIVVFLL